MTPILSTRHQTFMKAPAAVAADPTHIITDDIVVGVPMPEAWADLKYSDLLDTVKMANPDTHIRRVEIANGGLTLRIIV